MQWFSVVNTVWNYSLVDKTCLQEYAFSRVFLVTVCFQLVVQHHVMHRRSSSERKGLTKTTPNITMDSLANANTGTQNSSSCHMVLTQSKSHLMLDDVSNLYPAWSYAMQDGKWYQGRDRAVLSDFLFYMSETLGRIFGHKLLGIFWGTARRSTNHSALKVLCSKLQW